MSGGMQPAEYRRAASDAVERLARYVEDCRGGAEPVSGHAPLAEVYDALELERWVRDAGMDRAGFAAFLDAYLAYSARLHHPGFIAHQTAVPDGPAALADLIHGAINNPMAVYEMGPSAVAVEFAVLYLACHREPFIELAVRAGPLI